MISKVSDFDGSVDLKFNYEFKDWEEEEELLNGNGESENQQPKMNKTDENLMNYENKVYESM